MMTLPAGSTIRDWADAADAARNASPTALNVLRHLSSGLTGMTTS
jgi:hypothetical protein